MSTSENRRKNGELTDAQVDAMCDEEAYGDMPLTPWSESLAVWQELTHDDLQEAGLM